MAATADKYSHETLNDRDTTSGQTTTKNIYALQPLALTEYLVASDLGIAYANMTDAQKKDDTGFKNKFFVHEVWHKKDGDGKEVVIGLINPNATGDQKNALHAAKRKGKLRLTKGGVHYIVLNDGGLNTKPHAEFSFNGFVAAYTNYVKVLCNLTSAYYLRTEYFQIDMNWTHEGNDYEYSFQLPVGTGDDKRILPAKTKLTQFAAIFKGVIGYLHAGDVLYLTISANNAECNYTGETDFVNPNTVHATVKGAMNFIQVYKFTSQPTSSTDPLTGTPYAMLISDDQYKAPTPPNVTGGGCLYRLLTATGAGDPMAEPFQNSEILQGVQGNAEDAYDATLSDLEEGWYYGVPKSGLNDSTLVYVHIDSTKKALKWMANPYVQVSYNIVMSVTGTWDVTYQYYIITVSARVTGTRPNSPISVSTELHRDAPVLGPRTKLAEYSGTIPTNANSVVLTRTDQAGDYTTDRDFLTTYNTYCAGATNIEEGTYATPLNPPL